MMIAFIGLMLMLIYDGLFGPSLVVKILLLIGWVIWLIFDYVSLIDWRDEDDPDGKGS